MPKSLLRSLVRTCVAGFEYAPWLAKNFARVSHKMVQFVLEIAHLHWLFRWKQLHYWKRYPLKVSYPDYGSWFQSIKSIRVFWGGGGAAAGRPVSIVLGNFRATFCGLVATSSNFWFSGQFLTKTMIGLEHRSNTKKSTISQRTSSYAKFVGVNQPESKVQKGKNVRFDNNK